MDSPDKSEDQIEESYSAIDQANSKSKEEDFFLDEENISVDHWGK